jgi:hypothetical protein
MNATKDGPNRDQPTDATAEVVAWFRGRLPDEWTAVAPTVTVDRDEITVIVTVPAPDLGDLDDVARAEAIAGRIQRFRDETRDRRIEVARVAEHRFERKVSWGVTIDDRTVLFTHLAVPTMTRLRQSERQVLDTLVAAGVARSRADALAWCVRLVGEHTDDWLARLRAAIGDVDRIRAEGPDAA